MSPTDAVTTEVERSPGRIRFPRISPRAYEHPADRGALGTLRQVPGFPEVLRAVSGAFGERSERLMYLGSAIRVGPKQFPALHAIRQECAEILDLDTPPQMFVARDPKPNGMTIGLDAPFIVLTTGLVETLDTEALRFVIGHETGHALSGHALYQTMLLRMLAMVQGMSWTAVGYWGMRAIIAALLEWFRKAELSADRAGLLCGQDPAVALRAHVLMAGAISPSDVDTAEFLKQAGDYEGAGDVRDSVLKLIRVMDLRHPLAVVRAAELQKWAASEDYRAVLAGQYPRRGEEPTSSWRDDLGAAAKSYRDSFSESTDPLAKVLSDVGGALSDAAGRVWRGFGNNGNANGNSGAAESASEESES